MFKPTSPTIEGLLVNTSSSSVPFKQKEGKLRFDFIPPEMDLAFAEVATFGVDKLKRLGVESPDRNWEKGLKLVGDHLAAAKRHINKWERGIDLDEESGLNHLKHSLWHIAAMVTQIERGRIDLDDRPSILSSRSVDAEKIYNLRSKNA